MHPADFDSALSTDHDDDQTNESNLLGATATALDHQNEGGFDGDDDGASFRKKRKDKRKKKRKKKKSRHNANEDHEEAEVFDALTDDDTDLEDQNRDAFAGAADDADMAAGIGGLLLPPARSTAPWCPADMYLYRKSDACPLDVREALFEVSGATDRKHRLQSRSSELTKAKNTVKLFINFDRLPFTSVHEVLGYVNVPNMVLFLLLRP
jgi:hypothetical protein